jgi:23S rRNA (pseudouridine1915-N3)-methyltransferase
MQCLSIECIFAGDSRASSLIFCIGGPYGLTEEVRSRADVCIRLSDCVLNHQVARVVLLEQLYRAWTIIRREPYHH